MKGTYGLILAIGLGIVGALLNFAYLANKSAKEELVGFVGIRTNLQQGERLRADAIEEVLIPARVAGTLKNYAVLWSARDAEVDKRVTRNLPAGSLLLLQDMRSPPAELDFGKNLPPGVEERAWFVPVDLRRMVPSVTPTALARSTKDMRPSCCRSWMISRSVLSRSTMPLPSPKIPG